MTLENKLEILNGDIVSFVYNEYNITGIIKDVQSLNDGGENITEIKIVPFSEWGKVPELQSPAMFYLDQVYNFQILSKNSK